MTNTINAMIATAVRELVEGRWTASGQLKVRQELAQLEIAKALNRIADVLEEQHGKK